VPVLGQAPAHAHALAPRAWRQRQLCASVAVDGVAPFLSPAEEVAGRVLGNMVMTVGQLAVSLESPGLTRVLRTPLPYDAANPAKPALMIELMPPAGGAEVLANAWEHLHPALHNGPQTTKPFVLQTGVSGVGKTKVAYDIGLRHGYVVVVRVVEHDALTPPWLAFREFAGEVVNTAARGEDGLPPLVERTSLKAALVVLLGAHLKWAVDVSEAALSEVHAAAFGAAARAQLAADDAAPAADGVDGGARRQTVLREVVLRAQRNGLAYRHVAFNFRRAVLELLAAPAALAEDGTLQITEAAAAAYLDGIVARARVVWQHADGTAPRIVWAHDEAHALLDGWGLPHDLFTGTHVEPRAAGAPAPPPSPHTEAHFCLFYGLLSAIRTVLATVRSGHLLLGASLDLSDELLARYSPAQGLATATQQAVHLTAADIRAWFARYLTPAAMDGITDEELAPLAGRPLFASLFWTEVVECSNAVGVAPADVVRTALAATVRVARAAAVVRMERLWRRYVPDAHGYVPSRLLRTLFYDTVTNAGARTALGDARAEARSCLLLGVLNLRVGDTHIRLADEPVTAAALRELGTAHLQSGTDGILALLAERMTHPLAEVADQGPAQEACLGWAILRGCLLAAAAPRRRVWVPLLEILGPYLARDATTADHFGGAVHAALRPFRENEWEVCLTEGRRCDDDEWAGRSPLSLLAAHPTALLHHLPTAMAGADIMFLVRSRRTPAITVPVVLQLKNCSTGSLADALRTLDVGKVHPDDGGHEVPAHADMRDTLAAHAQWALPIRCMVGARPFTSQVLHDVAWLNRTVLSSSPLLLMQLTVANLGVDIAPRGAAAVHYARPRTHWPACAMPSRVRHWTGAPLPALVTSPDLRTASLRVRFSSASATKDELVAAVDAVVAEVGGQVSYRRHWLQRAVTAKFTHAAPAMEALLRCRDGAVVRLRAGGADVAAAFA